MRKKQLHSILRALIAFCLISSFFIGANSCQKEEHGGNEQTFSERFFAYDGQVKLTESIIRYLRTRNDSVPFVEKFAEKYGMPMWSQTEYALMENGTAMLVPVKNDRANEIKTIWVFKRLKTGIFGYPVQLKKTEPEDRWIFDYFTQVVLPMNPLSGVRFETEPSRGSITRGWVSVTTCKRSYAGMIYYGELIEVFTGWRCIDELIFIKDPLSEEGGMDIPIEEVPYLPEGDEFGDIPMDGGPPPELAPGLKALFKGNNQLNDGDTGRLNEAYVEMLKKCFYEYIDNYLRQNNVQLNNISIDPNYGGQAGISNTGNLTFWNKDEITAENLSHEWIHLFQKQHNNMTSFGDKRGMMEFEVALVQDILELIGHEGKWEIITRGWACFTTANDVYQNEYMTWLNSLTNNGKSYPSTIDNSKYHYFSKKFAEVSRSYGYGRTKKDYENGVLKEPVDYKNIKECYTYEGVKYSSSAMQALFNNARNHCNK